MFKTKKNGFLKASGIMLASMMLATGVISGTMAKYKSTGTTEGSVSIAKWDIQVGSSTLAAMDALQFEIYDTVESGGKFTNEDDNVKKGMIAPGTWGFARIEIKNVGEVDANISATFTKNSLSGALPAGMKFEVVKDDAPVDYKSITGTTLSISDEVVTKKTGTLNLYVAFVWSFESNDNDANDMTFASGAESLKLGDLAITATQVD